MIKVISDGQEIEKLHKRFQRKLKEFFTEKIDCWVGYPGGSYKDTVHYSPDLNLWISVHEIDTRYWNGFGIGKPHAGANNSLNGEINFPYEGINRRIAGAFAVEDNGNILVLHRGRIGGGKRGVGKNLFTDNFRGDKVTAIDGDRETEFCLVGELSSPYLPKQVANFISEIKRIKNLEDVEEIENFEDLINYQYTAEGSGKHTIKREGKITFNRIHGIVVDALVSQLQNKGYKVANDRDRDLFIYNKKKITTLFEIKTSFSTQCLYSAVGQLLIYSIPIKNEVDLIIVLPEKLNRTVEKRLEKYGIRALYYEWNNDEPVFTGLNIFLEHGVATIKNRLPSENRGKSNEYLYNIINKGIDVSNYGDPSQWQKKVREDRI